MYLGYLSLFQMSSQLIKHICVWLVFCTLTLAGVTIVDQPDVVNVPLGKETFIEIVAEGAEDFAWFKDGSLVSDADTSRITVLPQNSVGTFTYQATISGEGPTVLSDKITLNVFSVAEQLGSPDIEFSVPDQESKKYSAMIPSHQEGILLKFTNMGQLEEAFEDAPANIQATVEGPTILTFRVQGAIMVNNREWWGSAGASTDFGISLDPHDWLEAAVTINDPGPQIVNFGPWSMATRVATKGILDNLQQQKEPIWVGPLTTATAHPGTTSTLTVRFNSIEDTQGYVLKGEEVVGEMETRDYVLLSQASAYSWPIDSLDINGTYTTRIENTYGILEDEFELFVAPLPQDGFDTSLLDYPKFEDNHMRSIWYTQTDDTHDGVDAISWKWGSPGNSDLTAKLNGPAWVTFWWKNPDPNWNLTFSGGASKSIQNQPEWSQHKDFSNKPHWLYWSTHSETAVLDQLEIDYLDNNPFKEWLYPQLLEVDFEVLSADIETSDYDRDEKSNLLEWVLGGDPLSADPAPSATAYLEESQMVTQFTFESPADLGPYEIVLESSNNLSEWTRVEGTQTEEAIQGSEFVLRTLKYTHSPDSKDRDFLRLSVFHSPK